jgi:hypothetical protein
MDQESALSDLFRAVGRARGSARTVLTHAARSDSKGNGQAEKAVQSIEEILRTLFIDLEQRCGEELSVHDSFFPWLMEHACDLMNRYKVRKGNKTAWEYLTGEAYTGDMYAFGTPVMHRMSGPVQGGVMSERWFSGIWIGLQFSSGEHIIALSDGRVVRARAVDPRPDTVKVTKESLTCIKVGPWDPSEVITQGSEIKPPVPIEETQPSQRAEPVPRSVRITQERLERFGFTKGCPKCEALRRGDDHKTVGHNTDCRKRMESEMAKDSVLSQKMSDIAEKKQGFMARQVEASDRERVEAESASSGPGNDVRPNPEDTVEAMMETSDPSLYTWMECSSDEKHGLNKLKKRLG